MAESPLTIETGTKMIRRVNFWDPFEKPVASLKFAQAYRRGFAQGSDLTLPMRPVRDGSQASGGSASSTCRLVRVRRLPFVAADHYRCQWCIQSKLERRR